MTKFQRGIVVASALVTVMGGWAVTAQATTRAQSCGIVYGCADEEGCQFGQRRCEEIALEQHCGGTYQMSWCSLLGCSGYNGVACVFS